jgi:hypothetical protein
LINVIVTKNKAFMLIKYLEHKVPRAGLVEISDDHVDPSICYGEMFRQIGLRLL